MIALQHYADLSEYQTARAIGISLGAVRAHTARGMAALGAALEAGTSRAARVAQVLTAAGALDGEAADQILDEFALALGTRRAGSGGRSGPDPGLLLRSAAAHVPLAMLLSSRPPADCWPAAGSAGGSAAAAGSAGPATARHRVVPVGQMIPVRAEGEAVIGGLGDVSGEMYVLSCAQAACGARLTVAARTRGEFVPPGIAPTCRYQPYAVFPVHELAALCARLNVTGHGITAPPARALPEPWLSLLTHYRRRKPRTTPDGDGCAALAAAFPDLDGIRLALLGLHHSRDGTELFAQAGGLPPDTYEGRLGVEPDLPLRIWIRDSGGRWHATCARGWSGVVDHGEVTMRLQVLPPLSRAAAWIDVLASGQSAEVHVTLPLRWQ